MELNLIVRVVVVGVLTTMLALTLKGRVPEFSLVLALGGGIVIFFMVLPGLSSVLDLLKEISGKLTVGSGYIPVILKVVGIAYIAEFGAQVCMDDGETAIASKIELAGKVLIMYVSAPILLSVIDVVTNMLP